MANLIFYTNNSWALAQEIVDKGLDILFYKATPTYSKILEGVFCLLIEGDVPSLDNWELVGSYDSNGNVVPESQAMLDKYNSVYTMEGTVKSIFGQEVIIKAPKKIGEFAL